MRANGGARRLLARFVDAAAVPPEVAANLVRLTLHPRGLRPSLVNWAEVAAALVERLQRAAQAVAEDAGRHALVEEVRAYPDVAGLAKGTAPAGPPAASLHLRRGDDELRLFALLTTVGAPLDVTAEELAIESFFPVDEASARWLRAARSPGG